MTYRKTDNAYLVVYKVRFGNKFIISCTEYK